MRPQTIQHQETPSTPIDQIVLPPLLSVDVIVATAIVRTYGATVFPGIDTSELLQSLPKFDERIFEEYLLERQFVFDLLRDAARPRSPLTHRVIGLLELQEEPVVLELEYWIEQVFAGTAAVPGWLQNMALNTNADTDNTSTSTTIEHITSIEKYLRKMKPAFDACAQEWKETQSQEQLAQVANGFVAVASMKSNNPIMHRYLHYCLPHQKDVVVQEYKNGHFQVTVRGASGILLEDPARVVTTLEARVQQREDDGFTFAGRTGSAPNAPEWHFDEEAQILTNYDSQGLLPKSKLTLKQVVDGVIVGLSNNIWDPSCPPTGCRGGECPYYAFALKRCRTRALFDTESYFEEKFYEKAERDSGGTSSKKINRKKKP